MEESKSTRPDILIIDDDIDIRNFLRVVLSRQDYIVHTVNSGMEGMRLASQEKFDMILLDVMLGDTTGFEVCRHIKKSGPNRSTPVVFISGIDESKNIADAFASGGVDFISKPLKLDEVRARVQTQLTLQNALLNLERTNMQLRDEINERKRAEATIIQQEKLATVGQLAAGVAHEINNPIGFITSNLSSLAKYTSRLCEILDDQDRLLQILPDQAALEELAAKKKKLKIGYISEDIQDLIKESLDGASRVARIVRNLKSFARTAEEERTPAQINDVLESALSIAWNEIKYKAEVIKNYGDLPHTLCNPQQLAQVIINILVNGAHAIQGKGDIVVTSWTEDQKIFVSIADNGCGIPDEIQAKLFDPFFTTKEVEKGTGLGLSIALDIIRKHEGEITVETECGKGTTFIIQLPVVEGEP